MKKIFILFWGCSLSLFGQSLKPGFDADEYQELLLISARFGTKAYYDTLGPLANYHEQYRSNIVGLDNCWSLWVANNQAAVISIRGTTAHTESWLANFYAAMVPAFGELKLDKEEVFSYKLANNQKAAVHVGWLLSTAYLFMDIIPQMDSLYQHGTKEFKLIGHSQGGAITYLLMAHLLSLREQGLLPTDMIFKAYCSAAPKPGNLYFAYDLEHKTQNGWLYNVVNAADWVPETPISIQTLHDFNEVNPFIGAKKTIAKQRFPKNLVLKRVYNQLNKPTQKAQKRYQKYLGNLTYKLVRKHLPSFQKPTYFESNNYVRVGQIVVLMPDSAYYKLYPNNNQNPFIHHFHPPYLWLLQNAKKQ